MKNNKKFGRFIVALSGIFLFFLLNDSAVYAGNRTIKSGTYYIVSALNPMKVIDIDNASRENQANVQLWGMNNSSAQSFYICYSNGYYTIKNTGSNKYLDVSNGIGRNEQNVWQYEWNGTDAQKWYIEPAGDGYYYIKSKLGYYLDIYSSCQNSGTNIQIYQKHGGLNQKFKFIKFMNYYYTDRTLDGSNFGKWKKSVISTERGIKGIIYYKQVLSYKNAKIKIPVYGPGKAYVYKTIRLPHKVRYIVHKHDYNMGYGKRWFYTNGGIRIIQTCDCGYYNHIMDWEFPDLAKALSGDGPIKPVYSIRPKN